MTEAETAEKIAREADPHMKGAYQEMLAGMRAHPQDALWYAPWRIRLKADGTSVGDLCFKGPAQDKTVEIGYGVDEAFRGGGYAPEAVEALCQWAYEQEGVYFVSAQVEEGNAPSVRVLEKCGFKPVGQGEEGQMWEKEKPATSWMAVYMCLGLSIGMSLGVASDNMSIGMCLGIAVGMALGLALDSADKKARIRSRDGKKTE